MSSRPLVHDGLQRIASVSAVLNGQTSRKATRHRRENVLHRGHEPSSDLVTQSPPWLVTPWLRRQIRYISTSCTPQDFIDIEHNLDHHSPQLTIPFQGAVGFWTPHSAVNKSYSSTPIFAQTPYRRDYRDRPMKYLLTLRPPSLSSNSIL